MFCPQPFEQVEIYENGDVYTCCPNFIGFYSIGNIYKQSFDKIWNGVRAVEFREKIINSDFSLCNSNCNRYSQLKNHIEYTSSILSKYPREIAISSDNSCNVKCKICRDELIFNKFDTIEIKNEIEKYWLPIFKDAEIVRFGCTGEPFFSIKEKQLIKMVSNLYPDVKFDFHTNGILGNEKLLNELNVLERINVITVSIHAATEQTYNKIVLSGNYKNVLKNLKLYSDLKKKKKINRFRLIFVVMSCNYKEMHQFVMFAKNLGADVEFWAYRKNDTSLSNDYLNISVIEKNSNYHQDFLKVLKNPIFDEENVILYPEINNLRKEVI